MQTGSIQSYSQVVKARDFDSRIVGSSPASSARRGAPKKGGGPYNYVYITAEMGHYALAV